MPTYVLNHNHSSNIHASMRVDASHAFLGPFLLVVAIGIAGFILCHGNIVSPFCTLAAISPVFYLMELSLVCVRFKAKPCGCALRSLDPAPSCSCPCPIKNGWMKCRPLQKGLLCLLILTWVLWALPQAHICSIFLKFMSKKRSTECCLQP